ncbi:hypothetical protein V8F06_008316 [Rhypophila decipiens]
MSRSATVSLVLHCLQLTRTSFVGFHCALGLSCLGHEEDTTSTVFAEGSAWGILVTDEFATPTGLGRVTTRGGVGLRIG